MRVLLLTVALAYAADPVLKEGLWSITTEITTQPGDKTPAGTRSICRDHAYDASMQAAEKNRDTACKVAKDESTATKREFEADCKIGGTTAHIKRTVTFAGDGAAHSEMTTAYNPPLRGINTMTVAMDQKYIGSCPAGMKPGDFKNADGSITRRPGQ
jgi:hypothetical protein